MSQHQGNSMIGFHRNSVFAGLAGAALGLVLLLAFAGNGAFQALGITSLMLGLLVAGINGMEVSRKSAPKTAPVKA